ncbi:MAG: MBL fold metallo-hydrolase [Planctomycetota bacterium]|jgi:phosphoribosyl 1,2-cyclic phosphodiesterase
MNLHFYGTRGSIAVYPHAEQVKEMLGGLLEQAVEAGLTKDKIPDFIEEHGVSAARFMGGNSSCVCIRHEEEICVLDAGSGMRTLGMNLLMEKKDLRKHPLQLLMSHYHWDHLCGFPFFPPAYIPGNSINISGVTPGLKEAFIQQQSAPYFPVQFDQLGADIEFNQIPEDDVSQLGAFEVEPFKAHHPNGCYAYKIKIDGKKLVYMTDTELLILKNDDLNAYREFLRDADAAIVDSQYTFIEGAEKIYWGHSSIFSFIDICKDSNLTNLIMFHHDPTSTGDNINRMVELAYKYKEINAKDARFEIVAAYDGLQMDI